MNTSILYLKVLYSFYFFFGFCLNFKLICRYIILYTMRRDEKFFFFSFYPTIKKILVQGKKKILFFVKDVRSFFYIYKKVPDL